MTLKLYTTKEAAEILRTTVANLATWRARGKGPRFVRSETTVLYHEKDLIEYLEKGAKKDG